MANPCNLAEITAAVPFYPFLAWLGEILILKTYLAKSIPNPRAFCWVSVLLFGFAGVLAGDDGAAAERLFLENRVGLGDAGVKRLDEVAVFLFHHAALELQRKSEATIGKREIFGKEGEALDALVLREAHRHPFDLAFDERVRARMRRQIGIGGKFQAFSCQPLADRGGIWTNQRGHKLALITHDHGIQDVRTGLQQVLNRLRCHKFPAGGLQQVFLAVRNVEVAVVIKKADVARAEPAVFG